MKYIHSRCVDDEKIKEWELSVKLCNDINKYIFKKVEYAGVINFMKNRRGGMDTKNYTIIEGSEDSVSTPDKEFVNFHTHPLAIYKSEQTLWGWPSGDDVREVIRFAMKGNVAHLVFTVEGTYVMQVNPGIAKMLTEFSLPPEHAHHENSVRGIFFSIIEIYFKTTHIFRTFEALKDYFVTPIDFIKYVNNFRLRRILRSISRRDRNSNCGKLSCHGFPHWDNGYELLDLEQVIEQFGEQIQFIAIDREGNDQGRFSPSIHEIKMALNFFEEEIDRLNYEYKYKPCVSVPCKDCHETETNWPIQKIFNICLFYNNSYVNSRNKFKFGKKLTKWGSIRNSLNSIKIKSPISFWHPCIRSNCKL